MDQEGLRGIRTHVDEHGSMEDGCGRGRRLGLMSAISSDEVARVAALARVALSEEEVTRLAGELDAVASSFARVTSVVASDLPATSHPVPLTNVLRADVPGPTLDVDELLAGAPRAEDSMFLVPQILGEDSAS